MITLSPGLLYSAQKLIETVSAHPMDREQFLWNFRTMLVSPGEGVLSLACRCGWIGINEQLSLDVTDLGRRVQSRFGVEEKLRQQIRDFIQTVQPVWSKLLPAGRSESLRFMPEPAQQCFLEAGLCESPPSDEVISWWDDIAAATRGMDADYRMQIGREGERCSIAYEERRVGRRPEWQSIESNKGGFDLLSSRAPENPRTLQIEVKASVRPISAASFHLTQNEWEVARLAEDYVFHVWSLTEKARRVAILTPDEVAMHVPENHGAGQWETVEIPCRVFKDSFQDVAV